MTSAIQASDNLSVILANKNRELAETNFKIDSAEGKLASAKQQFELDKKIAQATEGKLYNIDPAAVGQARSLSKYKIVRVLHSVYYAISALFNKSTIAHLKSKIVADKALLSAYEKDIAEINTEISKFKADKASLTEQKASIEAEIAVQEQLTQVKLHGRKAIAKSALGFMAASAVLSNAGAISEGALVVAGKARSFASGVQLPRSLFPSNVGSRLVGQLSAIDARPIASVAGFALAAGTISYVLHKRAEARSTLLSAQEPTAAEVEAQEAATKRNQEIAKKAIILGTGATIAAINASALQRGASKVAEAAVSGASRLGVSGALFIGAAALGTWVLSKRAQAIQEASA